MRTFVQIVRDFFATVLLLFKRIGGAVFWSCSLVIIMTLAIIAIFIFAIFKDFINIDFSGFIESMQDFRAPRPGERGGQNENPS